MWQTFGERAIYEGPEVWLGQLDVGLPSRERIWQHVIRLHRAVAVVLLDAQGRVLFTRRYRVIQERWGWGHDSERAALIYLHSSDERQHQIADTLSQPRHRGTQARQQAPGRPGRHQAIGHATGTEPETSLLKIIRNCQQTGADLRRKVSAPSATRTRDLLLRRHNRPSAVQTSEDPRHQQAKQLQAVAL